MGQDASSEVDASVPPQTLRERSLEAVAELIRDGKAQRIVALTGAGISTSAGIPDFRSPGTGLYANLQRLNLPYAEAVFSIDYFREHPEPFYVLARELYPGQFQPTVSHAFLALLARRGLLRMLFTQNIDCLERAAGVPADRIVEAHGSFASQRCIDCGRPYTDDAAMRAHVRDARVPRCPPPAADGGGGGCGTGLVKPDIVFFGENLPARFHDLRLLPATDADLVLVLGTSLSVFPFAGLPRLAPPGVPRVLLNREPAGELGSRPDDVVALGSCDAGVRRLADALGWRDELEALWRGLVGDAEAERQIRQDAILAQLPVVHHSDSSSSSSSSSDEDGGDDDDDDDDDDDKDGVGDANDQPPEIGGAISSAEAEVNEIANEIEAVLKLDSGAGAGAADSSPAQTETKPQPPRPSPETKTEQTTTPRESAAAEPPAERDRPPVGQRPQL